MCTTSKRHRPPEPATGGSPGYMHAAQARRGSGAAGPHADRRTRRVRQRGSAARAAIRASAHGE
jgi:hypothetical protein